MFLKRLKITKEDTCLRDISFHVGLNLIVDETSSSEVQLSGNGVGKTTVLKLIDVCLGAPPAIVYTDTENNKNEDVIVKEYLQNNNIIVEIEFVEDLNFFDSRKVFIRRNFLSRKKGIREINGYNFSSEADFKDAIGKFIFPMIEITKPTFRQIISHSIRYSDNSLNHTLKTLHPKTKNEEYEALHLFLFGCDIQSVSEKQLISQSIKVEEEFKKRLEKQQPKSAYEMALQVLLSEINVLEKEKALFLNEDTKKQVHEFQELKLKINHVSSRLNLLKVREDLILETQTELHDQVSKIHFEDLKFLYRQAEIFLPELENKFEDLVNFHNKMIEEKINYIRNQIPQLINDIKETQLELDSLLSREQELRSLFIKNGFTLNFENIIKKLNEKYKLQGEYEGVIKQLDEVYRKIETEKDKLEKLESNMFSDDFESKIKYQLEKFNDFFAQISEELYEEKYAITFKKENSKGKKIYEFISFNTNISAGKKQGEISCFDIAYILFADLEEIPCLHFILTDKKELVHGNQLIKLSEIVKHYKIQFITSILKDKLPTELDKEYYFVLKLSQQEKLFKVENSQNNKS